MELQPGTRVLDRYLVESVLAAGGMGVVYRGRHERLGMPVALKVISLDSGAASQDRFEAEAELMAKVRHPNVVSILDFGLTSDEQPCIAMELVEGQTLTQRLSGQKSLPWPEALELTLGILAGLGAIHGANILHRDLKPDNIILCPGEPEIPKLIDLGIAKSQGEDARQLTQAGRAVGTLQYMSPEQLFGLPVDTRSDLYATTLILYEMLNEEGPLFATNNIRRRLAALHEPVAAPKLSPDLPPLPLALKRLFENALSLAPEDRPGDARGFRQELRSILSAAASGEADSAPLTPSPASPLPQEPAAEQTYKQYLLAARLPPSRLADPAERRWLAELVADSGRGYSLGAQFWLTLVAGPTPKATHEKATHIAKSVKKRFGRLAKITSRRTLGDFQLSPSCLTGAEPLPQVLQDMLAELAEGS